MKAKDNSLEERLDREARFHDAKYAGADLYPRHYSVVPTQYVYEQMHKMIGDLRDKRTLEYGCGEGWITQDLARMGAEVFAFDVSSQAIEQTGRVLDRAGLRERCTLDVMPAEKLNYADDSFDVAVGFAIIHHLDLAAALSELHRVLRPGGVAYFAEPLGTNPAIQLYRRMTPQYRTEDERPLVLTELPELLSAFRAFEHREFFLTALTALGLVYLPGGAKMYRPVSVALHRLDRALLRWLPGLGRWGWYTVLKVTK
jgi:SAM-dependent methyltransferase